MSPEAKRAVQTDKEAKTKLSIFLHINTNDKAIFVLQTDTCDAVVGGELKQAVAFPPEAGVRTVNI